MFGIENYTGFLIAGILLNLTPGQDTVYILGRSIAQGRKAGIASALGIATGSLIHTIAAGFGLSAILFSFPAVFEIIKYLGACYLGYLGIQMLLSKSKYDDLQDMNPPLSIAFVYRKGIITNLLNPKVSLFFIAFLPQFVSNESHTGAIPFLILGVTFIITGLIWCLVLAYFSSGLSKQFRSNPKSKIILDKICGLVFVALGIKLLFTKK